MEPRTPTYALQLQRTHGGTHVSTVIQRHCQGQGGASIIRQCYYSGISQQPRWSLPSAIKSGAGHLVHNKRIERNVNSETSSWKAQLSCRHAQPSNHSVRVDVSTRNIPGPRSNVRTIHGRQICFVSHSTTPTLQLEVSRPSGHGRRRLGPARLGQREQLHQSTLPANTTDPRKGSTRGSNGDPDCSMVAQPTMVQDTVGHDHSYAISNPQKDEIIFQVGPMHRAPQESKVEALCIQSIWQDRLQEQGWSEDASHRITFSLADSTVTLYNRQARKLQTYCESSGAEFPPQDISLIADFLCNIARTSDRPKSILTSTTAALTCLYNAMDIHNPIHSSDISKLITALIKSQTLAPRIKTAVMPVVAFSNLFANWKDNEHLAIKDLRLKAITLMALAFMLRPSDIAPRAVHMQDDVVTRLTFSQRHVIFHDDGGFSVSFHGIKNDYHRDGFTVRLPPGSDPMLDPATTLKVYMSRTSLQRLASTDGGVFLTLKKPFHALASSSIGEVLCEAIKLAGLANQGYSAKSFRPTAATHAVATGCDSNIARQVGRWKSHSVFEEHYVHTMVPDNFIDKLVNV